MVWDKGHNPPEIYRILYNQGHIYQELLPSTIVHYVLRTKELFLTHKKNVLSKIMQQNQIFIKQTIKLYRQYYKDASFEFWCCIFFIFLRKHVFPKNDPKMSKKGHNSLKFRSASQRQALPLNEYWQVTW